AGGGLPRRPPADGSAPARGPAADRGLHGRRGERVEVQGSGVARDDLTRLPAALREETMALNRREFLKTTTLGAAGPSLAAASPMAAPGARVLVVVNLFGGNDGLDTVVPLQEYTRYRRMRPTMAMPQANILPLAGTPEFGLNPGLTAIRDLYAQGKVAILNGVGVPKEATGLFDHSAQQFEFQTCDVVRANSIVAPTGWLGRYLDTVTPGLVAPGIDMGGGKLMLTGSSFDPLTIGSIDELQLQISFDEDDRRAAYQDIMAIPHADSVVGEKSRLL